MGADSLKSALETEDYVPKTEHIDPINPLNAELNLFCHLLALLGARHIFHVSGLRVKSCLMRDDLHLRAHLHSKAYLLTPALKEIQRTRAKCLLQWHAENGHKNILVTGEKSFNIEEQYNNQNNKIYVQMSIEVCSEGAGGYHPSYVMVWWGDVSSGCDTSAFL
jgi:hypothetical protein